MLLSEEQLARIKKQAETRRNRGEPFKDLLPAVYAPKEGIMYTRFYVDHDGEFIRDVSEHRIGKLAVPCNGSESCEICRHNDKLKGWSDINKYRATKKTICYACILKSEGVDKRQARFIRYGSPVILIGHENIGDALNGYIADLASHDEISEFLDPGETDYLVKIRFDGYFTPVTMTKTHIKERLIPALPKYAQPLSQCLFPKGVQPERSLVARIISAIDEEFEKSNSVKDWTGGTTDHEVDDLEFIGDDDE